MQVGRGRRPVNRGSKKATHLKETNKSSLIKARSGKGKSQGQGSREADDDDTPCMYCGEKYGDSVPGEQWLQCGTCNGWCHVDCSSGETSRGFVCDFCC